MSNRTAAASDVIVIGGGVIGLAVAWRACERGLRAVVLERGRPGHATSWLGAGMLAPIAEANARERRLLALGLESARMYPAFVTELQAASGREDVGYLRCGTLLAARDADEAQALERELALRASFGLRVARLRASAARRLEPALAPTLRLALDVPDDHAIDPRKLTAALVEAIVRRGGEVRAGAQVARLTITDGRVRGVALAGGTHVDAEHVVIAAGVWSPLIEGVPAPVPVRAVKGQIMRLHDRTGPGLLTRVTRLASTYVVPRGDGRYVIGATMEERGFDTTVTAGAAFELLRDASELIPGVSELVIDELAAGLRPATPDNAPVIGAGDAIGLHWATGHHRNGILLAPVTAELVAGALAGGSGPEPAPPELAGAFAPERFAGAVPGGRWPDTELSEHARVEVLSAIQGG
ncbi:MAG: glycine oxidase ThiO [Solirubrobacteraceae bacterium]